MNVKEITAGSNHNLVLTKNNELYAWGCNKFGQCGQQACNSIYVPKLIEN